MALHLVSVCRNGQETEGRHRCLEKLRSFEDADSFVHAIGGRIVGDPTIFRQQQDGRWSWEYGCFTVDSTFHYISLINSVETSWFEADVACSQWNFDPVRCEKCCQVDVKSGSASPPRGWRCQQGLEEDVLNSLSVNVTRPFCTLFGTFFSNQTS